MRKILLLSFLFSFSFGFSNAQRTYNENVSFSYTRNPLQPLPKEIKTYSVEPLLTYAEEVATQQEEWENEKAEMIARNEEEKQEYKDKSLGNKLLSNALLDEKKPEDIVIEEKYFAKVYDPETVSAKISLDGYETGENSDLGVLISMNGFDYLVEEIVEEEKKDDVVKKEYKYKISYRHPMEVKLVNRSTDEEIFYSDMPAFNDYKTTKTRGFSSKYALQNYWKDNNLSVLSKLDEQIKNENLKELDKFLDNQFGYTTLKRTAEIGMVKPRKYDYDEYTSAFENIFMGYSYLLDNAEEARQYIQEAVNLWEAALKESDPDDRKARIDNKVTAITHLNCAQAYVWLNDFQKAKIHLMKLKMLDMSRYNSEMEGCQNLLDDRQKRYEASLAE
ncbi:MAG: hypothetical protein V2I54_01875 [Bacteroidales bacterium]|jgi:hypothetical protein|nr:hypothetical protein [Bacteroidales bacterium]